MSNANPDLGVLVSHFDIFRTASSMIEALKPFAENPEKITGSYPCHSGLVSKERCGRCSSATRAWTAMQQQQAIYREYLDREWVIFSQHEYDLDKSGFWSPDGWTELQAGQTFFSIDILELNLPSGKDVIWLPKDVAERVFKPAGSTNKP